jgi:iron complex transport system substrate-binding protein
MTVRKHPIRPRKNPLIAGLLVALCILAVVAGCASDNTRPDLDPSHGITITQSDGTPVKLPGPARRIVVANGNAAELLMAIGDGDRIVGVTDSVKEYPVLRDRFGSLPSIGSWQAPDVETILSLNPDVIITYGTTKPKNADKLVAANITLVYLDCYRITTLANDARQLGILTGDSPGAEAYARFIESLVNIVANRTSNLTEAEKPKVYFESYSDWIAQAAGSGGDLVIQLTGGRNIAAMLNTSAPKVSAEWILQEDPSLIFKVVSQSREDEDYALLLEGITGRPGMRSLRAVKEGRIYLFSNEMIYGPRAFAGMLALANLEHPDRFGDIDPQTYLDDYAARFLPGSNMTGWIYPANIVEGRGS